MVRKVMKILSLRARRAIIRDKMMRRGCGRNLRKECQKVPEL